MTFPSEVTPIREARHGSLLAISAEVIRARKKFPRGQNLLAALTEEVGELAKALLQGKSELEVKKECVQIAAVAVRIFEEGCPEFDDLTAEERQP